MSDLPDPQPGETVVTTMTVDYLGRVLTTPATAGKDFIGRDVVTGDLDYLGRGLA